LPVADLESVIGQIVGARKRESGVRAVLVAITGIDGSGKGYLAARMLAALQARGIRGGLLGIDGWLNLPNRRFSRDNPAEYFYLHALRFEELFSQLVFPLRDKGSIRLEADFAEETATSYHKHVYEFSGVEVILLEGIYLLKRAFQDYYDTAVWIDCSFDTALERAIAREQEGLAAEETINAYRTIYFPAQEIHFERDHPREAASAIINKRSAPPCLTIQHPAPHSMAWRKPEYVG
jgi:uridine kinase